MRAATRTLTILAIAALSAGPPARARQLVQGVDELAALGPQLAGISTKGQIFAFGLVAAVELPSIGVNELVGAGGSRAVDLGTFFPGGDITAGVSVTSSIDRVVDPVWAAWVRDLRDVNRLSVQYDVVGSRGSRGRLDRANGTGSSVGVQVTALRPQVLLRFGRWRYVVGGARFSIDVAGATGAGRYSGQLRVTVFTL